jgi:hypothetical protein
MTDTEDNIAPAGYPKHSGSKTTAINRKVAAAAPSSTAKAKKDPRDAALPLDEEAQEQMIVSMLHDNLKARKMMRQGLGVLSLFVALASLTFAWQQHEAPFDGLAAYFSPLRGIVQSGQIVYALGTTFLSTVIQCMTAMRAPAGSKINTASFVLSLVPLVQWGAVFFNNNLYNVSWGFVWPAIASLTIHALEWYGHRVFNGLDKEVLGLVKLQYNLKSA